MGLGSFFRKVGVDLEKVLIPAVDVAQIAEPEVDFLFPEVATLYNGSVNEAVKLLAAGSAAAAQGGSGTVQLENVAAVVEPQLTAYLQKQGLPAPTAAQVNAFTADLLKSLQTLIAVENGTPIPTVTASASPAAAADPAPPAPASATVVTQKGPGLAATVPA